MKSRGGEDITYKLAVARNPFFAVAPIKLTTEKTQVETTETLFWLIECTGLFENKGRREDEWLGLLKGAK